jgi:hypothetical protein
MISKITWKHGLYVLAGIGALYLAGNVIVTLACR